MPPRRPGIGDQIGVLITYSTLVGTNPTRADLISCLTKLNRTDIVLRLAWVNAAAQTWQGTKDNQQDTRIRNHLFPWWTHAFERWTEVYGDSFLFSRYTILWLLRQALAICPVDSGLRTHEALRIFGDACLIANDLATAPKTLRTSLEIAASLLPVTEYASQNEYDKDVARNLYLLTEDARIAVPDLPGRIEALLGYKIEDYCDLAFATAMKPVAEGPVDLKNFQLAGLTGEHFRSTTVPVKRAQAFLESLSATAEELRTNSERTPERSLTSFRNTPLLRQEQTFVPLDLGFVLDKAGRGLFWTAVKNSEDRQHRDQLLSDWGTLHEHHLTAILRENLGSRSTLLTRPAFPNNDEAGDAAILEGRTLILIECKASTLSDAVKYVDDPIALANVLDERFVVGHGKNRKGIAQLSRNIQRFTQGEALEDPSTGRSVRRTDVGTIIPVILHVDNALRTPGIPHYLNMRFKEQARIKRPVVTPLVVLPLIELEQLEGHFADEGLTSLLESFLAQAKTDPAAVFFTDKLPVLRDQNRKRGTSLQRLDAYLDTLLHRLFPNAPT